MAYTATIASVSRQIRLNSLEALERMKLFSWLPFFKNKQKNLPWWVVIRTAKPRCTYYFGPFDTPQEAKLNQGGYVEDLMGEGADGITIEIQQCQPEVLTIEEEDE
ncbi:protein of unknown function (DUF1816) [Pleurocapsa sp. PCC 7327]|nr:protein of unknown function (DUF1816) [Pleurocapsa sp. PCC 7327]